MESINQFHMGELGTKIIKCQLNTTKELILVSTSMGSLQAFVPLETRDDVSFFSHLEMFMRLASQSLCGADHITFRSTQFPIKNVIDGDLCQTFDQIEPEKQVVLAEELETKPTEVVKRLE